MKRFAALLCAAALVTLCAAPTFAEETPATTTEPIATVEPAVDPTAEPTAEPTEEPAAEPAVTAEPTVEPTTEPTAEPTVEPTTEPVAEFEAAEPVALAANEAVEDATPGQAANELAMEILNSQYPESDSTFLKADQLAALLKANPQIPVTAEQAAALTSVLDTMDKYHISSHQSVLPEDLPEGITALNFTFGDIFNSKIQFHSLKRLDENTLELSADSIQGGDALGVIMTIGGLDPNGTYALVYVAEDGTKTVYDCQLASRNGMVTFLVPHFCTYQIVTLSTGDEPSDSDNGSSDAGNGSASNNGSTASNSSSNSSSSSKGAESGYVVCPSCGHHDWTGAEGGYKCDNCGYVMASNLAGFSNVKGTATLASASSAASASAVNPIKATGASMNLVVLAVLAAAAAVMGGCAYAVKKH